MSTTINQDIWRLLWQTYPFPCAFPDFVVRTTINGLMNAFLDYRPLDDAANAIRVLTFPIEHLNEDVVVCNLLHVSLNSFSKLYEESGHHLDGWDDDFSAQVDRRETNSNNRYETPETKTASNCIESSVNTAIERRSSRYTWGDFETLSYTWGNPALVSKISVNGTIITVPENLECALRMLRRLPETILGMYYWVDALCINQVDTEEKSKQVQKMKDIYGSARALVVWLGKEHSTDAEAETIINALYHNEQEKKVQRVNKFSPEQWYALADFTKRPYWGRLWIIQEVTANDRSTLFVFGERTLSRPLILSAAKYCQKEAEQIENQLRIHASHDTLRDAETQTLWARASQIAQLLDTEHQGNVKADFNGVQNRTLHRTLYLARTAKATDPRDNVYGLLGLLDASLAAQIHPDYQSTKLEVYSRFAIAIIRFTRSLDEVICWAPHSVSPEWPSWVPDWTLPLGRRHIQYLRRRHADKGFSREMPVAISIGNSILLCRGMIVDTVDSVSLPTGDGAQSNNSNTQANATNPTYNTEPDVAESDAHKQIYTPTNESVFKALTQTMFLEHPSTRTPKSILFIPWSVSIPPPSPQTRLSPPITWDHVSHHPRFPQFDSFRRRNHDFMISGLPLKSFFPPSPESASSIKPNHKLLYNLQLAMISLAGRVLICTSKGYIGLAPESTQKGDAVVILSGCSYPVVLRDVGLGQGWKVIGEMYVRGLMEGEAVRGREGAQNLRVFSLC